MTEFVYEQKGHKIVNKLLKRDNILDSLEKDFSKIREKHHYSNTYSIHYS